MDPIEKAINELQDDMQNELDKSMIELTKVQKAKDKVRFVHSGFIFWRLGLAGV